MRPKFLGTFSIPWISLGTIDATAAAADVTLAATERNFQTNKALDNVVYFEVPKAISALKMRFLLTTDDEDVDIEVWTGKLHKGLDKNPDEDCNLIRRGTLDVICGQQDVFSAGVVTTKHYADTATVTNDGTENGWNTANPGTDHVIEKSFDLQGDNIVVFHGFGTFDEDCEVEVSGYS